MTEHVYIAIKFYPDGKKTYEVFESVGDLLAYVVQEKSANVKLRVYKLGECIGEFS